MVAVFKTVANSSREMAVLLVLLDYGISLSELEGLNDADVDVVNGAIKVFRKKTLKERYVYVSPPTTAAILKWITRLYLSPG